MTADGDVAFPGAKFGDYTAVGDSLKAFTGAANTGGGVDGNTALTDLVTAAKARSTNALDNVGQATSGSIDMLAGIDGA